MKSSIRHHQQERQSREKRNVLEVVHRIERQPLVQRWSGCEKRGARHNADGVSVGSGSCDVLRRNVAERSDLVLHDNRLSNGILQFLGVEPDENIGTRAWRKSTYSMQLSRRPSFLRSG